MGKNLSLPWLGISKNLSAVTVLAFLVWASAVWILTGTYYSSLIDSELRSASKKADQYLADLVQGFDRIVSTRAGMQRVMARNLMVKEVLGRRVTATPGVAFSYEERKRLWTEDQEFAQVNHILQEDAKALELSLVAILDRAGNYVAASDAGAIDSHVGKSDADQAYFSRLLAGKAGYEVTVGKHTGAAGIAFFTPISDKERIFGGLISRIDLPFYRNWLFAADSFLTDRNGVIVLAKEEAWTMRALVNGVVWQMNANSLQATYNRSQFGAFEIRPWGNTAYPELRRVDGRDFPVLHRFQRISSGEEPVVHVLWPFPDLVELQFQRVYVAAIIILAGSSLIALVISWLARRREHLASHAAIAAREREFRTLAEASPDLVVRYDDQGRFLYVNPAFERTLGRALKLLRGKRPTEVPGMPEAEYFQSKVASILQSGLSEELEHPVQTASGELVWHLVHFVPERDETGWVRSVLVQSRNITHLKLVESDLRESRRRFAEAERIAHVGSWEIDHIQNEQHWSDELYRIYEIDPASAKANDEACLAVTHPDDREVVDRRFRAALAAGAPFQSEYRLLFPDGRIKYVFERSESFFAEDGTLMRTTGMVQDISERRYMEEALRRGERDFRSLAENVPDGIMRVDREGRIRYVNPQAATLLGIEPAAYVGRRYDEVDSDFPRDPDFEAALGRLLVTGEEETLEIRILDPRGQRRLEEVRLIAEHDEEGRLSGALVVGRDVTELKRYEKELRSKNEILGRHREQLEALVAERTAELVDSERRFRSLAENAPDNIIRYDNECRVVYANPRVERTLNMRLADMLGKRPTEIVPDEPRYLEFEKRMYAVLETGGETDLELTVQGPDGKTRYHYVRFVGEYDDAGRPVGILAIGRDMTEVWQVERQLRMLVSNIPDYISHFDADGRLTYVNPASIEGLKLDADSILGKPIGEIVGESHEFAQGIHQVLVERTPLGQEGLWPSSQGLRYFEVRDIPEFDHEGNLVGVLAIGRDITERKQAEERLLAREREFRTLAENIPDHIIRFDALGRKTYLNSATSRLMGVPAEKLLGQAPLETPKELRAAEMENFAHALQRVLTTGVAEELELVVRHAEAGMQIHHVRFVAERNESGEIVGALMVGRDISAMKEAEAKLNASEQAFRALVEHSPDGITRYDQECRRVYVNPAALTLFGCSEEEVLGTTPREFSPVKDKEHLLARLQSVLDTGKPVAEELEVSSPDGRGRWVNLRLVPEFGPGGSVISVLSIWHDITERKQIEDALRTSEREFRTLADNLPDCVVRYDSGGRATYFNAAMAEVNGDILKPLGKRPSMLPGIPPAYGETLDRVLQTGVPDEFEMVMPAGMGSSNIANIRFVAERDEDGRIVGALAIGRDITELKLKEREIKASRDQIRRLAARQESAREEERRHIARELHDELGQQLTALRLNVNVVDMRFSKQLPELHGAIEDLLQKVDRTIQVARNVATSLRPATLDMGLQAGLDWLVSEFRKNTGITCEFTCPTELPVLNEEQSIVLFRITQESLTNVVRHSGAQCVELLLTVEPGYLILEIIDNGCGFDAANINPRKFGLVGMRERVLAIDGVISIQSEPGQGTRVWVRIPLGEQEQAQ